MKMSEDYGVTLSLWQLVIPLKKAMHGWTSQPWHTTVVFMLKGACRGMVIPGELCETRNPEGETGFPPARE